MGKLEIVPFEEIVKEVHDASTFRFRASFDGSPGQFIMVWIPGHDEVPMALSYLGDLKGITVRAYGDATKALLASKPGDWVGVRGPYGNTFRLEGLHVLCVAGGVGIASLIAAIEGFSDRGAKVATVLAAKTAEELIFEERCEEAGEVHIATDDGTRGFHGLAPALAKRVVGQHPFEMVATCGPEPMMKAVVDLCRERKIACQASVERFMKCGIGICDACVMDDVLVCRDGPVFTGEELAKSRDFGKFRRDESGRRVPL